VLGIEDELRQVQGRPEFLRLVASGLRRRIVWRPDLHERMLCE
jgi:hypothetical protein